MPVSVRLIASDLDGTLFGSDHVVAPRTVDAVNAVVDAGITFVAVTGRSHFGGSQRAVSTGARLHWFIGSNGGHRLNYASGVLEERLVFDGDRLAEVMAQLPSAVGEVGFGCEHEAGFSWDERFLELYPVSVDGKSRRVVNAYPTHASSATHDDVGKLFVAHPEVNTVDLVDLVRPHVPADWAVTTSGVEFVEVTPPGADKGRGLARLCERLAVDAADVVAFGDNHNDLTMLEWAGRGVAMGNALTDVKARADEVTASNDEHGVALVLESLL